jgi:hypothetical protein
MSLFLDLQEHGSQTMHELLDQYILTLIPAGYIFIFSLPLLPSYLLCMWLSAGTEFVV